MRFVLQGLMPVPYTSIGFVLAESSLRRHPVELCRTVACLGLQALTRQVELSVEVEWCWAPQPGCFCHCCAVKGAWMCFHRQPCGITAYSKSLFSCTVVQQQLNSCEALFLQFHVWCGNSQDCIGTQMKEQ